MKKWLRSTALAAVLATGFGSLAFVGTESAMAQGAKTPTPGTKPAEPPKVAPKAADAKGKVVYAKDKQGKYRVKVLDADGKTLMMSPVGYEKVEDALKLVDEVKALINSKKPEEEK